MLTNHTFKQKNGFVVEDYSKSMAFALKAFAKESVFDML